MLPLSNEQVIFPSYQSGNYAFVFDDEPKRAQALIERLDAINSTVSEAVAKGDAVAYIRRNLEFHRTLYLRAQAPAMLALAALAFLRVSSFS